MSRPAAHTWALRCVPEASAASACDRLLLHALIYLAGQSSADFVRWVLLAMCTSDECLGDAVWHVQARTRSRMAASLGRALQTLGHPRLATSPCPPSSGSASPH